MQIKKIIKKKKNEKNKKENQDIAPNKKVLFKTLMYTFIPFVSFGIKKLSTFNAWSCL